MRMKFYDLLSSHFEGKLDLMLFHYSIIKHSEDIKGRALSLVHFHLHLQFKAHEVFNFFFELKLNEDKIKSIIFSIKGQ